MPIFRTILHTAIEALFPASTSERELFSYLPEKAYAALPPAPPYDGLAVELPGAESVFAYNDRRVADLVWNIKYKKSRRAIEIGGYALWQKLSGRYGSQSGTDGAPAQRIVIIPMPITAKRRRERGYNQCELIVDELKRLCRESEIGQKVKGSRSETIFFEYDLLLRVKHSSRQTLKGRQDRLEAAKGIFGLDSEALKKFVNPDSDGACLKEDVFIIVDDVITTGSTMKEAMDTLKRAGIANVLALSLAH